MTTTKNGNGKVVWWLMGIIAVLFTVGAAGLGRLALDNSSRSQINCERIEGIKTQLEMIDSRQERMDTKLDRILDKMPR